MRELERLMQETREKAKQIEQTWEKQKTERIKELRAKKVEIEKELMILETSENVENIDPSSITSKRSKIATSKILNHQMLNHRNQQNAVELQRKSDCRHRQNLQREQHHVEQIEKRQANQDGYSTKGREKNGDFISRDRSSEKKERMRNGHKE